MSEPSLRGRTPGRGRVPPAAPHRLSPAGDGLAMQIFVKTLTGKTITLEVSRCGPLIAPRRQGGSPCRGTTPGAAQAGKAWPHPGPVRWQGRAGPRPPSSGFPCCPASCSAAAAGPGRAGPSGAPKCRDARRKAGPAAGLARAGCPAVGPKWPGRHR